MDRIKIVVVGVLIVLLLPILYQPPLMKFMYFSMISPVIAVAMLFLLLYDGEKRVDKKKDRKTFTIPEGLSDDEKRVVEILIKHNGIAFQKDIVKESGFSKAKVSRILDRLEYRGIIERKRSGNVNVVYLKQG